jgi:capsular polysaccharide biosynthesis protein/Mrp family chromosome partitioning ATPase
VNSAQRPDSFDAADYTGVLRRRWWIVVALAIAGVIGAYGYTKVAPKTYTASAVVYVAATGADQANPGSSSKTTGPVNLNTEAALVTSGTVSALAGHLMHSPLTPYQLAKQITVSVPPSSSLLTIACKAPTAQGAATCAQDFATAYLKNRSSSAAAAINGQLTSLTNSATTLESQMGSLNTKIKALPSNSATKAKDQSTLSSDRVRLSSLNGKIASLQTLASDTSGGHIVTAALVPAQPSSPKKSLVLPSGLAVGLILGLILAFVWDRRDKRLHKSRDIERLLNLPVMLDLPARAFGNPLSIAGPRSATGRAFTELAQSVSASLGEGTHVLLVTGATPGPAGSLIASNLAATLARSYSDVVLVCADLSETVAPDLFGVEAGSQGLAEIVAGTATVRDVACGIPALPGLWVIPPGADPALAVYNLQHDRVKALVSQLRRDARFVIVEAQASEDGADTFAVAEFADAALLAIEVPDTTQPEANATIRRLRRMQTMVLGAAVLPPIGRRFSVRPLRAGDPRLSAGQGGGGNGAVAGRDRSALPGSSSGSSSRRDRPVRSREGHGETADSAPGR